MKRKIQFKKLHEKFSECFRPLNNQTFLQTPVLEHSVLANDLSSLLDYFSSAYDSDIEALKCFAEGYDSDLL